ncbi:protein SCAF11 [Entelurus aequoreus]|uniref:protein SCAF11 n=1 Tax=Entelurus aequoreus TaxID=161455 RepID=UPI002B1DFA7B|nr:protein SCAF11 [Entelurus aequoreus]
MTGAESGGQGSPSDGSDSEEAERCPICLGVLARGELAMPDSCCHVFCLGCLLTWAELQMVPSCPVDRRPFRNVYRWDGGLRCVQVPVRRRVAEAESGPNTQHEACLKNHLRERSRRQQAKTTAHSKTKGLVRKCNDDPSSVSRKKVRGTECCAWPSSPFISLTTSTPEIAEPLLVTEDILYESKHQVQDCPWFSPAAPITATGTSSFLPTNSNHSTFTFGLCSSPVTSTSSSGPAHFVFQGVVCAITCPKGGEKRGGRASNSKAPTKKAESLPSRRSGRNSKPQAEPPASDPPSPPKSNVSDSDSSVSQPSEPGRTSQVPAKRKGKQVTNRKAGGKRKNTRKKQSSQIVECPTASEDEEADGVVDSADKEGEQDEVKAEMTNSKQTSDADASLNADQDGVDSPDGDAEPLSSDVEVEQGVTETCDKDSDDKEADDCDSPPSCSSNSPPKSPESCSDGKPSTQEDEPPAISISTEEEDGKISTSPPEPENMLENLASPDSIKTTEQDGEMEVCAGSDESSDEEHLKDPQAEACESPKAVEHTEEKVITQETKESEESDSQTLETAVEQKSTEVDISAEAIQDDDVSKDDNNVIPMDCSSPLSEHGSTSGATLEVSDERIVSAAAETPSSVKEDPSKDQEERDRSHERKNGRQRRSRFHSATSSWSPKRDSRRDASRRSRSRERASSPPSSRSSRPRSRERERDRESDYSRRDRSKERNRRRSRSHSRSRSRSPSRTRSYRRESSPERPPSKDPSPQRKDRQGGWRSGQGIGNGSEGRRYQGGAGRFENGLPSEASPERRGWSENPDWVTEKTRSDAESRNRDLGGGFRWEDRGNGGESRGRGGYDRGRGTGRQPRNNSGTGNHSGNDAYSRFNENRGGGRWKQDSDTGDGMLDRSGWSSASSWAVRRTLPADVRDYYSKRERGGTGGWNRTEEEQPAADAPKSDPTLQAVPGNAAAPVLTAMPPPLPPQLNVLQHHFPPPGHRGPLPVSLQPAAPYAMPPPVPVHLHPAAPLLQVPGVGAQGLPPPPPPPPPMQQGGQAAAAPPDIHTQMGSTYGKPGLLPAPNRVAVAVATQGQQAVSHVQPSSTTQPGQHSKAQADSSKKEKKQQIQEKAVNEVRIAIKPYYQNQEITKDEYKEIVRKAVEKVCHSKSGEVNSSKVANLVKAYVDKYKHARKK